MRASFAMRFRSAFLPAAAAAALLPCFDSANAAVSLGPRARVEERSALETARVRVHVPVLSKREMHAAAAAG